MMKKIGILFFALALLPAAGWAGELKLIKGKGVEVCKAYQKSLQSMSLQDMVCGEKADTKDFKRPKWGKLDFSGNKELLKKISNFISYGDQFAEDKGFGFEILSEKLWQESEVMGQKFPPMYALYTTKVDVDNDGMAERILLFREYICMFTRVYSRPLFVLDEAKNQIDVEKTEPLLQNPFPRDIKAKAINHLYQLYDIFFYRGKTYFDKWNMRDKTLNIYKQSKNETKEVCSYKYQEIPKKGGENHGD